jgi:hypothetical protein
MSHTDIRESGTCAALPLRDAWGRPRRTDWWRTEQQTPPARRTRPVVVSAW